MVEKVNLAGKLGMFDETWSPKIVGEVDGLYLKVVKFEGEFVWHSHDTGDELFQVLKGQLVIKFRDGEVALSPGELIVIPAGVEHLPVAENEVHVLLIEPKATLNTGDVQNERTVRVLERI
jgi:mannose-6-phosphate isomerase-like protein (cupin superfamily)